MGNALTRTLLLILILALLYFSQRFWIRTVRGLSRATRRPWLQLLLRSLALGLTALLLFLILQRLAAIFMPIPRIRSRFFSVALGLWVFASAFSYLAILLVRGVEWSWTMAAGRVHRNRFHGAPPPAAPPANPARRRFFRTAAYAAGAAPFAAALYGFIDERFDYVLHRVEVPIPRLPAALDGLRITQLSDIHISSFMSRHQVRRAVDMANRLGGDLAVVTGDLLTGRGDPLDDCVAELSRLRAPLGVWGCNGNHEIYAHVQEKAAELFRSYGMTMLRQNNAQITWRNASFNLIGVDYQREPAFSSGYAHMLPDVETLLRRDRPNILLSHNPNSFYRASQLGIELSLAGHTHGGQVRVEILDHGVSPASFITDYIAGLYRRPAALAGSAGSSSYASLYVNRGLGTIGIPVRLGVPPEITLLTLRCAT